MFGAVGAVKRVKLVKPGLADVVYVKSDDAVTAAKTYHNRELDGRCYLSLLYQGSFRPEKCLYKRGLFEKALKIKLP